MIKRVMLGLLICMTACTPQKSERDVTFVLHHYKESFPPAVDMRMRGQRTSEEIYTYLKRPEIFQQLVNLMGDLLFTLDLINDQKSTDKTTKSAIYLIEQLTNLLGKDFFSADHFKQLKDLKEQLKTKKGKALELKIFVAKLICTDVHRHLRQDYERFITDVGFWYQVLWSNYNEGANQSFKLGDHKVTSLYQRKLIELVKNYETRPDQSEDRLDLYFTVHVLPMYLPGIEKERHKRNTDSIQIKYKRVEITVFMPQPAPPPSTTIPVFKIDFH